MSGRGKLYYEDGTVYEGDFKNDMRDGVGIVTHRNGQRYKGEWKLNRLTGDVTYITETGKKEKGVFQGGKRVDNSDWLERYELSITQNDKTFDEWNTEDQAPADAADTNRPPDPYEGLTKAQIKIIKRVFSVIDTDGDGTVTAEELQNYLLTNMNGLRITRATVSYLIRKIDVNKDGII